MNYLNYWQYFNIEDNACDIAIKTAFVIKFKEIYNTLKVQNTYSSQELTTCIRAYKTLTTPYYRFLHNVYLTNQNVNTKYSDLIYKHVKNDFSCSKENPYFSNWLFSVIQKFYIEPDLDFTIVQELYEIFLQEKNYTLKLNKRS